MARTFLCLMVLARRNSAPTGRRSMSNINEVFAELVSAFEAAIVDQIKAKHGAVYHANTANLKDAAFGAFKELADSFPEKLTPMMSVAVWEAVMRTNDSAFHQSLERKEEAKTLPFKVIRAKRSPQSAALSYLQ